MPVQTRSAKKRQAAEVESNAARPLASDNTIIEITVSATGEGKHIRWIRPSREPGEPEEVISPDLNNDPRFKTPAPPDRLTSPPKLERRPLRPKTPVQSPPGDKILLNFEKDEVDKILLRSYGRNLYDEFSRFLGNNAASVPGQANNLESPLFNGGIEGRESRWLSSFRSRLQGFETPPPPDLQEEDDALGLARDALVMRQTQVSTSRKRPGLGPHGTILLGPDGNALVPDFRDGH